MQRHRFAAPAAMALVLLASGCTTARPISPTTYAAYAEGLKGSPAFRQDQVRQCVATVRVTPRQREILRTLVNLEPGRDARPVVCRRIVDAVASGRLTYAEAEQMRAGQTTPKAVRILQGR